MVAGAADLDARCKVGSGHMAPLLLCGFGIVFVLLRITSSGVDLVPDTIGLVLYAVGMWRLAGASRMLVAAATLAGLAAVIALSFFAPGLLEGAVGDTRDVTYGVVVAGALGFGAFGLRPRARAAEDDGVARQLLVLAVVQTVAAVALASAYAVNGADHDRAVAIIDSAGLLALLAMLWYAVLLLVCASHPWARLDEIPSGVTADKAA